MYYTSYVVRMERLCSNEEQLLSRASNGEDIQLLLDSISRGENTELHVTGVPC